MNETHIGAATYRVVRKMHVLRQSLLLTKMAPLFASGVGEVIPIYQAIKTGGPAALDISMTEVLGRVLIPVSRELSKTSLDDQRLVIAACLTLIDRKADGKDGWALR